MNHVLNWSDVVAYFGDVINEYSIPLKRAKYETYALLACRNTEHGEAMFLNKNGDHAEADLVRSRLWQEQLDAAISEWDVRSDPMVIMLLLNRAPCSHCAHLLASALHELNRRYAIRALKQYFVLGMLGNYHSNKPFQKAMLPEGMDIYNQKTFDKTFSSQRGFSELKEAGWKPCVLDFGQGLTRRGKELLFFLQNLA